MDPALHAYHVAAMRSYLARSAGEPRPDGHAALLDAALAGDALESLSASLEASVRLGPAGLARDRYTVSLRGEAVLRARARTSTRSSTSWAPPTRRAPGSTASRPTRAAPTR